jgi:exodeoxyribonuclease-1
MPFLFYDLETSGISPKWQRIMQFAGQVVDDDLKPVGEPVQEYVSLSEDILPDPTAVLLTGITPQQTRREGLNEADFWAAVYPLFTQGNLCITGYNTIRFDDEFLRYSLWRSLRDPYAWSYANGNSRWDLLDVARMASALRPDGLQWPLDEQGKPTNYQLGSLIKANGIAHDTLHAALADVQATLELARLLRSVQPKLWAWLHSLRAKQAVQTFVADQNGQPFVYSSGRYPKAQRHTTVVSALAPTQRGAWVYDLTVSPEKWLSRTDAELDVADEAHERLPIKQLVFNRAPAIAPLETLDQASQDRLEIDMGAVRKNHQALKNYQIKDFLTRLDARQQKHYARKAVEDVDANLYDGFVDGMDRKALDTILKDPATPTPEFQDTRLTELTMRYKARNFPQLLTSAEQQQWEQYRQQRLSADHGMSFERFYGILQEEASEPNLTDTQRELLTELYLYAQSIAPIEP